MTLRKKFERWELKEGKCEAIPQAMWAIAKSLMKMHGRKEATAIHGYSRIKYHPNEKANVIADR
jgi:hypothetical protein